MPRLLSLWLAIATLAFAGDDPTDVLVRLRDQVTALGHRIPNHICIETIQRDRFQPVGSVPRSCDGILARRMKVGPGAVLKAGTMDRLRLDVAMADGREIYSWAGARKFDEGDDDIHDLIRDGPIGTGIFASMLLVTFGSAGPRFFYDGDIMLADQRLMQYSFTMMRDQSEYRVKTQGGWWITGYSGTLLVEPKTASLVRVTLRTDELPPETSACETDTTLDYSTVQLGGLGYLLPKVGHQRFIARDGSEAENTITFSACQEYKSESTVAFTDATSAAIGAERSATVQPGNLPAGLPVVVELARDVPLDQAAAGDRIEGRLASPIQAPGNDPHAKPFAAAGALVSGRLMRVETRYSFPPDVTVVLRWETVDLNGVKTPLSLDPVRNSGGSGVNVKSSTLDRLKGLRTRGVEIELPKPGEARYSLVHIHGDHPVLKAGVRSSWVTSKP